MRRRERGVYYYTGEKATYTQQQQCQRKKGRASYALAGRAKRSRGKHNLCQQRRIFPLHFNSLQREKDTTEKEAFFCFQDKRSIFRRPFFPLLLFVVSAPDRISHILLLLLFWRIRRTITVPSFLPTQSHSREKNESLFFLPSQRASQSEGLFLCLSRGRRNEEGSGMILLVIDVGRTNGERKKEREREERRGRYSLRPEVVVSALPPSLCLFTHARKRPR